MVDERLMHYVWQHRLWNAADMHTVDGRRVRVIDPGLLNTDSGPDFFNAKIEIDGQMWAGNVEMHVRATDWRRHGHDTDPAYRNVVLHVVQKDDAPVMRPGTNERLPQMVLEVSADFENSLNSLLCSRREVACASRLADVPAITLTSWLQSLAIERLQGKADRLHELSDTLCGDWEEVCYITFARNLGFGINSDAFERLARLTPLRLLHKHSDSPLQLEALLLGQSGLLSTAGSGEQYIERLRSEYAFLQNKFQLRPMEPEAWKLFRIRPQSFPHRRIAMLAQMVQGGFKLMADILSAQSEKELRSLFALELGGYWATHYSPGAPQQRAAAALSKASQDLVLINTVAPLFYAYGESTGDEAATDRAVALLEQLRPERNAVVASFAAYGIECPDALTSQALLQLKRAYCEPRKCIFCKIGHSLLSGAARGTL